MSTYHKLTLTLGLLTCINWLDEAKAFCSCWNFNPSLPHASCGAAFEGPPVSWQTCQRWCRERAPAEYRWNEGGHPEFNKAKRQGCPIYPTPDTTSPI